MAGTLLDSLMFHLATRGIVRAPANAAAKPLPPFWRSPSDGAPAPGEKAGAEQDDGVVVSAFLTSEVPPITGEESRRQDIVDLHFRSKSSPALEALYAQIRAELAEPGPGGRVDYVLTGGVLASGAVPDRYIVQSTIWRGFQLLTSNSGQGYTYVAAFRFEHLLP